MPSYFWLIAWLTEVLEFGIITVTEEGADFKPSFSPPGSPGDKLGGVIVGAQIADHRDANRPAMFGNRRRKRRRSSAKLPSR